MKGLHRLAVVGLCAALFTACKKDDDPSPTERLTSGKWRMTAWTTGYTIAPLPTQMNESYDAQSACAKDDLYVFGTDGILRREDGATACSPGSGGVGNTGSWQLLDNGTKFQLSLSTASLGLPSFPGLSLGNSIVVNGDVLELSGSTLRIKGTTSVSLGSNPLTGGPVVVPVEINQSYTKQ